MRKRNFIGLAIAASTALALSVVAAPAYAEEGASGYKSCSGAPTVQVASYTTGIVWHYVELDSKRWTNSTTGYVNRYLVSTYHAGNWSVSTSGSLSSAAASCVS